MYVSVASSGYLSYPAHDSKYMGVGDLCHVMIDFAITASPDLSGVQVVPFRIPLLLVVDWSMAEA